LHLRVQRQSIDGNWRATGQVHLNGWGQRQHHARRTEFDVLARGQATADPPGRGNGIPDMLSNRCRFRLAPFILQVTGAAHVVRQLGHHEVNPAAPCQDDEGLIFAVVRRFQTR
jgi:hypothetical protein